MVDLQKIKELPLARLEGESERTYYARIASYAKDVWDIRNENPEAMQLIKEVNTRFYEYEKLRAYIYQYCKQYYPTYFRNHREDMVVEVFSHIYQYIRLYDGSIDITTFSKSHIKHGCSAFITYIGKTTMYYNEQYSKIKRVISKILQSGEERREEDITDSRILMELPELSIKRIHTAREISSYKTEAFEENYEAVSFETPEKAYEHNERKQMLLSVMQSLTPMQQLLITAEIGEAPLVDVKSLDDLSYNEDFLKFLKKENLGHLISLDDDEIEFLSKDKIKILYKQAMRIARNVPVVSEEIKKRDEKDFAPYQNSSVLSFSNKEDALETELAFLEEA